MTLQKNGKLRQTHLNIEEYLRSLKINEIGTRLMNATYKAFPVAVDKKRRKFDIGDGS